MQCLSASYSSTSFCCESLVFWTQVGNTNLFCKVYTDVCFNNKGSNLNTGMCVKLHTNACNYQISRFYTCAIVHILRMLSMNTTSILHPFYAHRDAAITLTSAAPRRNTWQVGQSMVNHEKALHILYYNIKWSTQSMQDTCHAQWEGWV